MVNNDLLLQCQTQMFSHLFFFLSGTYHSWWKLFPWTLGWYIILIYLLPPNHHFSVFAASFLFYAYKWVLFLCHILWETHLVSRYQPFPVCLLLSKLLFLSFAFNKLQACISWLYLSRCSGMISGSTGVKWKSVSLFDIPFTFCFLSFCQCPMPLQGDISITFDYLVFQPSQLT